MNQECERLQKETELESLTFFVNCVMKSQGNLIKSERRIFSATGFDKWLNKGDNYKNFSSAKIWKINK